MKTGTDRLAMLWFIHREEDGLWCAEGGIRYHQFP